MKNKVNSFSVTAVFILLCHVHDYKNIPEPRIAGRPHRDWASADICDIVGGATAGSGVVHLLEAMILMYCSALWAASLWALLQEMPVPWHTVTGEVDSSARH